jgi:hypothetical protein
MPIEYRQGMNAMLWWEIYLCGAAVAAVAASVVADLSSERDAGAAATAAMIVLAAISWPVVLGGLLQLICIAGAAEAVSAADRPCRAPAAEVHNVVRPDQA